MVSKKVRWRVINAVRRVEDTRGMRRDRKVETKGYVVVMGVRSSVKGLINGTFFVKDKQSGKFYRVEYQEYQSGNRSWQVKMVNENSVPPAMRYGVI